MWEFCLVSPKKQGHQSHLAERCLCTVFPTTWILLQAPQKEVRERGLVTRNPGASPFVNRAPPHLHVCYSAYQCILKKSSLAKVFLSIKTTVLPGNLRETAKSWSGILSKCYLKYELASVPFSSSTSPESSIDLSGDYKKFDTHKVKKVTFFY